MLIYITHSKHLQAADTRTVSYLRLHARAVDRNDLGLPFMNMFVVRSAGRPNIATQRPVHGEGPYGLSVTAAVARGMNCADLNSLSWRLGKRQAC
jgi:hypothetical protein